jgi:hypothetical protein
MESSNPVSLQIADSSSQSINQQLLTPGQSACFYAKLSEGVELSALTYHWLAEDSVLASEDSICISALSNGTGNLILTASDPIGGFLSDTISIIVNTPPLFLPQREYFSPSEDSLVYVQANLGLDFIWDVYDPDLGDSLVFTLYLQSFLGWTDSVRTVSPQGISFQSPLEAATEYQWFVRVQDRYGAQDSTPVFTFRTRESWDLPGVVHGYVATSRPEDVRVVALSTNGDTLRFPLDSQKSFSLFPGPEVDSLYVFAWDAQTYKSSDTILVHMDHQRSNLLPDSLR